MPTTTAKESTNSEGEQRRKRRFLVRLVLVMVGGMFLDGYTLGIVGPVSPVMAEDWGLSDVWQGAIAATPMIGMLIAAPIGGILSDKLGRKPLFKADLVLFCLGALATLFVQNPEQLFAARLVLGFAVGIEYAVGWTMLSETAPTRLRGRLMASTLVAWAVGFMVAYVVGIILNGAQVDWRITLASGLIPSIALLIGRIGIPESPRWLWVKGRRDEANSVASRYFSSDIQDDIQNESTTPGSFRMLFSKRHWRATVFVSVFWFCATAPYFAISTFASSILPRFNLDGNIGSILVTGFGALAVVMTVFLIDKIGRRPLTIPPQWACTIVLVVIGLWTTAPPLVVLGLFLAFSFLNQIFNTLTGIYPAEVFPTEIRSMGTGFGAAVSRLGGFAGTFLLPWSMSNLGQNTTMLIAAGVALVGAIVSQWLAPETAGRRLSETNVDLVK